MRRHRFLASSAALIATAVTARSVGAAPLDTDPAIAAMLDGVSATNVKATVTRLVAFGTRSAFSETSNDPARGVFAARAWIRGQFEAIARTAGGRMSVAYDEYTQAPIARVKRNTTISSVVATLRGDDPSGRTYVISSHYDSRNSDNDDGLADAPGADDNASAVACVLEAARVMARTAFRVTILFCCYDAEEQGLLGSGHHAKTLHDAGVPVEAVLNNDIIGASRGPLGENEPTTVRIFSEALAPSATARATNGRGDENDGLSRELARFAKEVGDRYDAPMTGRLIFRMDRFLRGGDQTSFAEQGYAAIRFVEPHENFDHQHQNVRVEGGKQYGDLAQYMDFDYLAAVTRYNVATLATLALGPGRPKNVKLETKELGYDATMHWDALPLATSYEILVRPSAAPDWTEVVPVGNVQRFTLKRSKDDFLFALRAVDAAGHRSIAAFPEAER